MPDRPNILMFMMDTQGTRNMSCYGYPRPTTPNISRIAAEGTLFENHFVTGYGGQCLECHALNAETGAMTMKSAPRNW